MKPRPPHRPKARRESVRDIAPLDVPQVTPAGVGVPQTRPTAEPDPIPEHIRKMLEAAYT